MKHLSPNREVRGRAARWPRTATLLALAVAAVPLFAQSPDRGFITVAPEEVQWRDVPGAKGLQTAFVAGDPTKPGVYVQRVKFSPGTMTRPHTHPEDRYAVVLKGTWWVGTTKDFLPATTTPLKPGSFMKHPAGQYHYDGAKDEEVIVQVIGVGPTATNLVNPELGPTGNSLAK